MSWNILVAAAFLLEVGVEVGEVGGVVEVVVGDLERRELAEAGQTLFSTTAALDHDVWDSGGACCSGVSFYRGDLFDGV